MLERLSGEEVFYPAAGWIWGASVVDHGFVSGTIWSVPDILIFYVCLWALLKTFGGERERMRARARRM